MASALVPHAACGLRARGHAPAWDRPPRGSSRSSSGSSSSRRVSSASSSSSGWGVVMSSAPALRGGGGSEARRRESESLRRAEPFPSFSTSSRSDFAPFAAPTTPAPAARPGYAATRLRPNAATSRNNSRVASSTTAPSPEKQQDRKGAASAPASAPAPAAEEHKDVMDRGLGLRRALSDETQSRPFQPLGGEVLHIGWLRTESDYGKVTRAEGTNDRECLEALLRHYTVRKEEQEELLNRVERGWSDVTFTLGEGYYCRLQRFSEFDTLTLSGPGNTEERVHVPLRPWQWLLPENWLASVPGRVFLCAHVVVRHANPEQYKLLDDADLWSELQDVTDAVGWESNTRDGGLSSDTVHSAARAEALAAIAEIIDDDSGEGSDGGVSKGNGMAVSLSAAHQDLKKNGDGDGGGEHVTSGGHASGGHASGTTKNGGGGGGGGGASDAAWSGVAASGGAEGNGKMSVATSGAVSLELETGAGASTDTATATATREKSKADEESSSAASASAEEKRRKERVKRVSSAFGTEEWQREQKKMRRRRERISAEAAGEEGAAADPEMVPPQWRNWGTQVESSRIVGLDAGGGVRFYANYHLDQEGAMLCMLVTQRDASVVQAARQLQRFFTIEQYRLLILARLPGAKSRYPAFAKLNDQYEAVAKAIRRMNSSSAASKEKVRRYRQQQEFLEKITDLEQATAQELSRAKSEVTIARAYLEIIESRFKNASFKPLGGEVRFLPPFVQKRLDPAVSTINSVAERAQILSDALERTTGLLQAGVEVRLQRLNERLALYGFVFTVLGVITTVATSVSAGGPLEPAFSKFCQLVSAWFKANAQWFQPALSLFSM